MSKKGTFITKSKFILAERVKDKQQNFIDRNGEEFIGLPGDWKIQDEEGYIYFLDKYKFKALYQPFDKNSFKLILESKT